MTYGRHKRVKPIYRVKRYRVEEAGAANEFSPEEGWDIVNAISFAPMTFSSYWTLVVLEVRYEETVGEAD